MRAGSKGPKISHLIFADDLLLFAEASVDQMRIILDSLNSFCEASGQKINPEKTSIVFSKNVTGQEATKIAGYGGFSISENLGRYLGAHIFSGRSSVNRYRFLTDKINSRLSGWKKQCLSLAGRLTLANSIMGAVANFHMQHDKIPKSILLNIEQSQRDFIWGRNSNGRKAHLINWSTLCKPKSAGGMNFKNLSMMNDAFILKIGWETLTNKEALWTQVLRGKYNRGDIDKLQVKSGPSDSRLWKVVVNLWPHSLLILFICWEMEIQLNFGITPG